MTSLNLLTYILETNRLTGPNFFDWFQSLKLVLNIEKRDGTLFYIPPTEIPLTAMEEEIITWEILKNHEMRAHNYILALMSNDL